MLRVLVTGSEGVLGKSFCVRMEGFGYEVIRSTRKHKERASITLLDVTNKDQVEKLIDNIQPDIIIHLAASFSKDFAEAFSVNVLGAHHILEAVGRINQRCRVLLVGSAAEYGILDPSENPVTEAHRLCPVSVYGLTKAWQTEYGLMRARQGMDVVIARIFNLDGRGFSPHLFVGRVDQQLAEIVSSRQEYLDIGSLDSVRDYVSLDEAVWQLIKIVHSGESGQVYHVASGKPILMRDFLKARLKAQGLSFSCVKEAAENSSRMGYDVPVIYADMSRTFSLAEPMLQEK